MERTQIQSAARSRFAHTVAAVQPLRNKQLSRASSACHSRIIALVPDADLNEARFAQALRQLSQQHLAPVLLMTVVPHYAREANARLRLALLVALLRESRLVVEMEIAVAADWLAVIGQHWHEGDLFICHAEHTLPHCDDAKPIRLQLQQAGLPVQEVSGFITPPAAPSPLKRLLQWLAPLAVVAVAFVIQAVVLRWTQAWAEATQHALLILTIVAEAAAVMFFINKE